MKKKCLLALSAMLLSCLAAFAVFNEKDLPHTLGVLRCELARDNARMENSRARMSQANDRQHGRMVDMVKKCNELSLILYSQHQDFTFDMTYALKEVTKNYESFNQRKMPFEDIMQSMDIEIDRYERLIESLCQIPPVLDEISEIPDSITVSRDSLRMDHSQHHHTLPSAIRPERPFVLDEKGQEDRDSCIYYARNLLQMYKAIKTKVEMDSEHYDETSKRLKTGYDYAQKRYRELQTNIFVKGQDNYFTILKSLPRYSRQAFTEASSKYSRLSNERSELEQSEWRGPKVAGFLIYVLIYLVIATVLSTVGIMLLTRFVKAFRTPDFKARRPVVTLLAGFVIFALSVMIANQFVKQNFFVAASGLLLIFAWMVIAILISLLIHLSPEQLRSGLKIYMPLIVMGLVVITFRIIFIPNRLMNLFFPPLLLISSIWQGLLLKKAKKSIGTMDMAFGWITFIIFAACTISAWAGFVFMSIQVLIWWLFQVAAIQTILAVYDIMKSYEDKHMSGIVDKVKGDHIEKTWLYDMLSMAVVPVLAILSVPLSLHIASDVFDLTAVCHTILYKPFFDLTDSEGSVILHLSLYKIIIASSLYFIFRYLSYAGKAFYKKVRVAAAKKELGQQHIRTNQVNLTLANNIIGIGLWGLYLIIVILLFKIPMGAISIVAAGLATGIGLALKDVLNNFIYGIQLMSGRIRVGDFIECDGVRGKVESISYQSTQIITIEGVVMSITNSNLFNKSFKNLTRNSPYEFIKIIVGVAYGTDVKKVCSLINEALMKTNVKDKYGRYIIEPEYGVNAVFGDFGDSSVDIAVKQHVIVEEELAYIARAKEIIYDTLNEAGIEIPFPQRDIHICK